MPEAAPRRSWLLNRRQQIATIFQTWADTARGREVAVPVFISDVEDVLTSRGLETPDLAMLQPTHQSYRTLLLQPSGPIYADTQRIGHLSLAAAAAKADAFLALAAQRGDHLVVTPEYFLPVSSLAKAAQGGPFPAEGALWVLGCESMTPAQLDSFKNNCAGHCDVIYEEDQAPAVQGSYFDPVAYFFTTRDTDKNIKRIVLFQFKTAPSRDDHGFENKQLRCGRAIYRFQGKDGYIKLSTIICSDALALGEDAGAIKKLSDRAVLIHIQLNPKPKHTDYRRYRNEIFRRSPDTTNCDIICLNWAENVVLHDSPDHPPQEWKNESGSAWYVPERRCSVQDVVVTSNEAKGLYYTRHEKKRHVLHFHYEEAVFALTVPKVLQDGAAVHDVLIGPQLDTRFTWSADAGKWLESTSCPETGWSAIINASPEVRVAFQSLTDIKDYLGENPAPDVIDRTGEAAFELLRRENKSHKNRVAVFYRTFAGVTKFAHIKQQTDITYDGGSMAWFSTREKVMQAASLAEQKEEELEREADVADTVAARLRGEMSSAGVVLPEDASLEALIAEAERLMSRIETVAARAKLLREQVAAADTVLSDLKTKADSATASYEDWELEWTRALSACRLDTFVKSVDDAEQALQKVEVVRANLEKAAATKKDRIDTMSADLEKFRVLAEEVVCRLEATELRGAEPRLVAAQLSARLADAWAAMQRREAAEESLAKAAGQLREAEQTVEQIQAKVAPLLKAAGVDKLDDAAPLVERSDLWRALNLRHEQARQLLTQDSDGLGLEAVVAEVDACDLGQLAAELAITSDALEATQPLLTELAEARVRAEQAVKAISGGSDAAAAESRRNEALADMAEASERYIKVATAVTLLTWAIDRYREQKQGPMLSRAGAIFAKLTLGRYSKLFVDYEKTPLSLSALRVDGRDVEVAGMSEGTRDQLYLALRLAALEIHLDKSKPLPFVADDLFINFDDERSTAGLEALRELSTRTQVLFLSHHDHLLPRVRQVFGDEVNVVALER